MAKETYTSRKELIEHLEWMAQRVLEMYGVHVWFAEIMGRRWSYIAGRKAGEISLFPPRHIELNGRFGLISDRWEEIPADESEWIISSLREKIKAYE